MAIAWIFLAATGMVIARCVSINDLNKNILCIKGQTSLINTTQLWILQTVIDITSKPGKISSHAAKIYGSEFIKSL